MIERADFRQWAAKDVARLRALLEAELGYYREIAAALPVPLAIVSRDQAVVWTNRAYRRRFGTRTENLPAGGVTEIPLRAWHDEDEAETLLVVGETAAVAGGNIPTDLPAIVWRADASTLRFLSVEGGAGTGAETLLGYPASHWLGRREFFEERIHPEDRAATMTLYRRALSGGAGVRAGGAEASAEYRTSGSGETVWCRETIRVSGAIVSGVITNITARKKLESQLLSGGRFEALYAFAGRLAHDLNNPLMIVTGYAEELLQALKADDPLRAEAGEIVAAARRIGGLAAQLTDFARPQAKAAARINLGDAILSLRPTLAAAAGDHIAMELAETRATVLALADPLQLGEVLSAAIRGARDSARDRTRVTVAWDVENVSERLSPTALAAGTYARITVRDDGRGLEAAQAAAIFDPVISKQADAEAAGAGMALARAYSVVHDWGGDIAFGSTPGHGSTFTIYLPHVEPEGPVPAVRPAVPAEPRRPSSATILVVDDEPGIRGLIRKILQREGYNVLEAGTAEEALALAEAQHLDLLVTDVMLPGIRGPELAHRVQTAAPGLKTLFISGYAGDEPVPAGARFLAKPFTLVALLEKVREALT